jgi:hypothetical protein
VKTCFAVGLGLYMLPKYVLWDLASVVGRYRPFWLLQLQILFFENVCYSKALIQVLQRTVRNYSPVYLVKFNNIGEYCKQDSGNLYKIMVPTHAHKYIKISLIRIELLHVSANYVAEIERLGTLQV